MPVPNAIGSQGMSRPGAVSASAHCRTFATAPPRPCGSHTGHAAWARGARRGASQVSVRPPALPAPPAISGTSPVGTQPLILTPSGVLGGQDFLQHHPLKRAIAAPQGGLLDGLTTSIEQ